MTFDQIIAPLKMTNIQLARALDVSDSHIADLKSKRRDISLSVALRLEALTKRTDIVPAVALRQSKKDRAKALAKARNKTVTERDAVA